MPLASNIAKASILAPLGGWTKGKEWKSAQLTFTVPEDGLYHIGIECNYEETIAVYLTNCHMTHAEQAADVRPTAPSDTRGVFRED